METMGISSIVAITLTCYLVGISIKSVYFFNHKFIPVIYAFIGALLGIATFAVIPQYPANDEITAIAVGVASGLSATGINQIIKQFSQKKR